MMSEIWKTEGFFIGDDDYRERMDGEVADFIRDHVTHEYMMAADGLSLSYYYALPEESKGTVVIEHGFCEFFEKLAEMVYYYYRAGFAVFLLEARGHGASERVFKDMDPDMVYVASFDDYMRDFHDFTEKVVKEKSGKRPLMAFGHSMGGCIVARTLEDYPDLFDRALLSSPMMSLDWGGLPMPLVYAAILRADLLRKDKTYLPGQHGFDDIVTWPKSSMKSKVRYDHMFECREKVPGNRCYGGCYAWGKASLHGMKTCVKRAEKIRTPVLMLTAGQDHMVTAEGQEKFLKRCRTAEHRVFPESGHEIYNATPAERAEYYDMILTYFSKPLSD